MDRWRHRQELCCHSPFHGGGESGLPVRALVSVIVNVQIIARQFGYGWLWLDGETAFQ